MRFFRSPPLILCLLLLPVLCLASAESDFQQGVSYYKQQKYEQAVKAFKKANQQGLKTPALYHNLGSSYFKLGNYTQAKKYFLHLQRFSNERMLAEYNLGLIAKKQNKPAQAKKHFLLVKNQAKNKKLVTFARVQLGEIKPEQLQTAKPWFVYASVGYGHDSNIAADPETAIPTKKSSTFTDIYVDGEINVYGNEDNGLSLTAAASQFDYSDFDIYDQSKFSFGVTGNFETGNWNNAIKLKSEKINYAHADYQRVTLFEADTKNYLSDNARLRLRYRYYNISLIDPLFVYLEGSRQRLRAEYKLKQADGYFKCYIEHESNDRTDDPNASYSPSRNTLRASYKYKISNDLDLKADASYRISTYPARGASTGREDKRQRYSLSLTYDVINDWKIRGKVEHTDNESTNAAVYSYQRDVISVNAIASF